MVFNFIMRNVLASRNMPLCIFFSSSDIENDLTRRKMMEFFVKFGHRDRLHTPLIAFFYPMINAELFPILGDFKVLDSEWCCIKPLNTVNK
jgi:hypothetical protein